MASKDRLKLIRQNVYSLKKVSVSELSKRCAVTEETIRRDLDKLEAEGVVTRIHGGAIWNEEAQKEGIHFFERRAKHLTEKRDIAQKVVPLLDGKRTIVADSSSTVMETLKLLPQDVERTILTNSTEVFREFSQSPFRILSTGGEFNKRSLSLQGSTAIGTIEKYHVEIALISCKGLSQENGVLDSNESEAEVKKAMLSCAEEVILLADSSKFDQNAFISLIDLDAVNYLVTDVCPEQAWVDYCAGHGIALVY
jgi:DeoR/GlpR family transcriptional regulator of sugar metabolism